MSVRLPIPLVRGRSRDATGKRYSTTTAGSSDFCRTVCRAVGRSDGRRPGRPCGRPLARAVGRSLGRAIAPSVVGSVGRVVARSVGRPVGRSVGPSVGRSVDTAVARSVARSVDRSVALRPIRHPHPSSHIVPMQGHSHPSSHLSLWDMWVPVGGARMSAHGSTHAHTSKREVSTKHRLKQLCGGDRAMASFAAREYHVVQH